MKKTADLLGFIGLGTMGAPMAQHLITNGYSLVVYDINPQQMQRLVDIGARPAADPTEVGDLAKIILVSLPDLDATREIALGSRGIAVGKSVKVFIDLSTTGSKVAKEVAAGLATWDIVALDAPVTGGIAGAKEGRLTIMVSGPKTVFDEIRPVLDSIAKKVLFVSEIPGQAQTVKVINNMLSATALAATCEAFVLGAKAGIDADVLLEVINDSSGRNSATDDKFPKSVLPRKFDCFGRTEIIYKDVCLCLEEAETLGVPMWVSNTVKQLFAYAISQGGAKDEMTTLVKYLEQWAGVEVKGRAYQAPIIAADGQAAKGVGA